MYPALAVLQATKNGLKPDGPQPDGSQGRRAPEVTLEDVIWIGGEEGIDQEILSRTGLTYRTVSASGVHGVGLRKLPGNVLQLARGYFQSRRILRRFQPDVMLFTGGYLAVPVALAGWSIPSVVFVPDIEPGLALKTIARLADAIAVTAEESKTYFSEGKEVVVTGYPVRSELTRWNKPAALDVFELGDDLPVVLVVGGSTGARSLNTALAPVLDELLRETQVIHITGNLDWPDFKDTPEELPEQLASRYSVHPYLHHRMGAALTAADLVVSRAGASVLGEFPAFGLPAVLVPYPHAWRYQKVNAQYLEDRQAAVIIEDQNLAEELLETVQRLIRDQRQLLDMKRRMESAAQPQAASRIARLLQRIAGEDKGGSTG